MLRKTSNRRFIEHLDIDLKYGDLNDRQGLHDIIEGHDYIVHPAGLIQAKSLDEFMRVNRDGTQYLLESVAKFCPGLKRFVYISSQAAAGPSQSINAEGEDITPHPVSDYGRSKLAGEEECRKLANDLPITILRPSAVYGPRDKGVLPFFKLVKSGWFWKLGAEDRYASIVYVCDLAVAVRMAIESDNTAGQTFFVANQHVPSIREVQSTIADIMKVEIKPLYTPLWIVRALVPLDAFSSVITGKARGLTKDKLRELSQRYWVCDPTKAEKTFGWKAETPIEDGIDETIEWYVRSRWL